MNPENSGVFWMEPLYENKTIPMVFHTMFFFGCSRIKQHDLMYQSLLFNKQASSLQTDTLPETRIFSPEKM